MFRIGFIVGNRRKFWGRGLVLDIRILDVCFCGLGCLLLRF